MRSTSNLGIAISLTFCCFLGTTPQVNSAQKSQTAALFRKLQLPDATDQATQQMLNLAKFDSNVRPYLARRLPKMIEMNPFRSFSVWRNEVRLAGELKIAEAAPALAKWIAVTEDDSIGTPLPSALETSPAARSLSQIGNPAVPALKSKLAGGKWQERRLAILVCQAIGSPSAQDALRQHLSGESDPDLRSLAEKTIRR